VYLTGKDSRRLAVLSMLPAPVLDAAKRRVFGLPAPGSLAGGDDGAGKTSRDNRTSSPAGGQLLS
jgi:hypothetical protein